MKLTLGSGRKIIPREKARGAGNSAGADNTSKHVKKHKLLENSTIPT